MKNLFRSGIFRRILLAILIVALIPLIILGLYSYINASRLGIIAADRSREALDIKSAQALEVRTLETANAIADFLHEREADIKTLVMIPPTSENYIDFYQQHNKILWYMREGHEMRQPVPLYREIAYIDPDGQEIIKIRDGQITSNSKLVNVSNPANTMFKSETFFNETRKLPPGSFYISHVTGFYVTKIMVESGSQFEGILRLAAPLYDKKNTFAGVVTLALDVRHLQEYTDHIVPTDERERIVSEAASGNYAYMVDDRGCVIAHPLDFQICGNYLDGTPLNYAKSNADIGTRPLNFSTLGFADKNLPEVNQLAASGKNGSVQYIWDDREKLVTYASIPFYGGNYQYPAGFGWVAIGAETHSFHEASILLTNVFQNYIHESGATTSALVILTVVLVLIISGFLAGRISSSVRHIIDAATAIENGSFDEVEEKISETLARQDELGQLARVFMRMTSEIYTSQLNLKLEVQQLKIEIDDIKRQKAVNEIVETDFFRELKEKAVKIRSRQRKER